MSLRMQGEFRLMLHTVITASPNTVATGCTEERE